ncbi:MAG: hypothetical protein QXR45_06125 [Candidatus Bathyarchaeia archaeon]
MTRIKQAFSLTVLLYGVASITLTVLSISIIWHLSTTEFPAHSDVFWIGVQSGALGVLSITLLILGLFFAYRIIRINKEMRK